MLVPNSGKPPGVLRLPVCTLCFAPMLYFDHKFFGIFLVTVFRIWVDGSSSKLRVDTVN